MIKRITVLLTLSFFYLNASDTLEPVAPELPPTRILIEQYGPGYIIEKGTSLLGCMFGDICAHQMNIRSPSMMIATVCMWLPEDFENIFTKRCSENFIMGSLALTFLVYPDTTIGSIAGVYVVKQIAEELGLSTRWKTASCYLGARFGGFLSSQLLIPAAIGLAKNMVPDMLNQFNWYSSYFSS